MCEMRRAGESPLLHARHLAHARQLGPAFAEIVAVVEMRRLGARVHARLAIDHLGGERINLFVADAGIAPLPGLAEIRAGVDLTAVGSAEKRFGRGLEDDRTEVLSRNHRPVALP
jgi:hypothetical protein